MTSVQPTPPMPARPTGARPQTLSTAITRGYVEMLHALGRNEEAAALEAKGR